MLKGKKKPSEKVKQLPESDSDMTHVGIIR